MIYTDGVSIYISPEDSATHRMSGNHIYVTAASSTANNTEITVIIEPKL